MIKMVNVDIWSVVFGNTDTILLWIILKNIKIIKYFFCISNDLKIQKVDARGEVSKNITWIALI